MTSSETVKESRNMKWLIAVVVLFVVVPLAFLLAGPLGVLTAVAVVIAVAVLTPRLVVVVRRLDEWS